MPPRSNQTDFINKAIKISGTDITDYSKVIYIKSNIKVILICKINK